MDFIFFKFVHNRRGKNLLIRRDDVNLRYLRKQTRQLYQITKDNKFALSMQMINEKNEPMHSTSRHYYCTHPNEKPEMSNTFYDGHNFCELLISNKQLQYIRKGKRKNHADTRILITVHTDSDSLKQFYTSTSPVAARKGINKAFMTQRGSSKKKGHSRSRSRSSSLNSSLSKSPYRTRKVRETYKTPIRIIKMKVDNTYDYKLPPFYLEAFAQYMLESDEGMRKLYELHQNYPLKSKSWYNVVDYINSMDYAVRSMEIGLGLQNGGVNVSQFPNLAEAAEKARKGRESNRSVTDRTRKNNESFDSVLRDDARGTLEIEDTLTDNDDVFANNPSNLMLAKIRVKTKKEKPKTDAWCCECKKWKCLPNSETSLANHMASLEFSEHGNLLARKIIPASTDYGVKNNPSDKSATTQPTLKSKRNSNQLKPQPKFFKNSKINFQKDRVKIKDWKGKWDALTI